MPALQHFSPSTPIAPTSPTIKGCPGPQALQRARGRGELTVKGRDGGNGIERLYQQGCAKIRLPRRSDNVLEAVLINSSGGVTGGDRLDWSIETGDETRTMVTTQACERLYRTVTNDDGVAANPAVVNVDLTVGAGARFSWLPQETLFFDAATLSRTVTANLSAESEILIVEPVIFGRAAMGEKVASGSLHDRWRIYRDERLLHAEDFLLSGDLGHQIDQAMQLNGQFAVATILLVSSRAEDFLKPMVQIIDPCDGLSAWNGKLLARVMAKNGYQLRKKLLPVINLLNFEAQVPKVWAI